MPVGNTQPQDPMVSVKHISFNNLTKVFNTSCEQSPGTENDPSKIASYRIITMENTIGKLPEKAVSRRLAAELEEKL